jgi:hypothetical protein
MILLYFFTCGRTNMFGPAVKQVDSEAYIELEDESLKKLYHSSDSPLRHDRFTARMSGPSEGESRRESKKKLANEFVDDTMDTELKNMTI